MAGSIPSNVWAVFWVGKEAPDVIEILACAYLKFQRGRTTTTLTSYTTHNNTNQLFIGEPLQV